MKKTKQVSELFQGTAKNAPMTPKEASAYIGFSVETLKKWRREGKQPPYATLHNRVYYQQEDLDNFLNSTFCPPKKLTY